MTQTDWIAERDAGLARAKSHAEALDPQWSRTAYALLESYCLQVRGRTFTSEDFRAWCEARQFPIPVPKALGAVFLKASKRGVVIREGFAIAKERHGSPCPLWRAT